MPTKVSEKKLLVSILLLAVALFLLFTAKLSPAPVQVSEKGLFALMAAIALFALSVRSFSRSLQKK